MGFWDIVFSIGLCALFLAWACVRGAKNAPLVEDDQFTPEQPFPGPVIEYGSVNDRLAARDRAMEDV